MFLKQHPLKSYGCPGIVEAIVDDAASQTGIGSVARVHCTRTRARRYTGGVDERGGLRGGHWYLFFLGNGRGTRGALAIREHEEKKGSNHYAD